MRKKGGKDVKKARVGIGAKRGASERGRERKSERKRE